MCSGFAADHRSLKAVGVDVTGNYDSGSLGSRLLDAEVA